MRKCSWHELCTEFNKLDKVNEFKRAVIVFNPEKSGWKVSDYSFRSKCYSINSGAKYFDASMSGSSIFADCLDGTDQCLKLSNYLGDWHSDYCIIFDNEQEYNQFLINPKEI